MTSFSISLLELRIQVWEGLGVFILTPFQKPVGGKGVENHTDSEGELGNSFSDLLSSFLKGTIRKRGGERYLNPPPFFIFVISKRDNTTKIIIDGLALTNYAIVCI
jgi:hypothetical protein